MYKGVHYFGVIFCCLLGTSLMLSACQGVQPTPTGAVPASVELDENQSVSASAEVVPAEWRQVGYTTSGIIDTLLVTEGEPVLAGQELARLETAPLRIASSQANANLRRAEAALQALQEQPSPEAITAAEAAVTSAEANLDQLDAANARDAQLEAAQAQLDSAEQALDQLLKGVSEAQISAAAADVQVATLALEQARQALKEVVLLAPFDGRVVEIYVNEGDAASPGVPVMMLADLDDLRVETTDLSELDVARVSVGNPVSVTFDALPDVTVTGRVSEVALKATPGSNITFKVIITLDEIPAGLRWGMTAFVTITP
jgi:multidrug efflux pump subunit AcrA (membrane-fusion protein)